MSKEIRRGLFGHGAVFFMASILLFVLSGCEKEKPKFKAGDILPVVSLPDMTGKEAAIPDDFKGKVVVIRFWADWCKSCADEMPAIDIVYKKLKDKGLVVLAINTGQTKDIVEKFLEKYSLSYPVFLDVRSAVAKQYGVVGLPTTIILDRDGRIRNRILGEAGGDIVERVVLGML